MLTWQNDHKHDYCVESEQMNPFHFLLVVALTFNVGLCCSLGTGVLWVHEYMHRQVKRGRGEWGTQTLKYGHPDPLVDDHFCKRIFLASVHVQNLSSRSSSLVVFLTAWLLFRVAPGHFK